MLFNGSLNCGSADDILEWRQFEWWVIDGLVFCESSQILSALGWWKEFSFQ